MSSGAPRSAGIAAVSRLSPCAPRLSLRPSAHRCGPWRCSAGCSLPRRTRWCSPARRLVGRDPRRFARRDVVDGSRSPANWLPLAALLDMAVLFPGRAPTRFKVARRAGDVRQLQALTDPANRGDQRNGVAEAAEQILALVGSLRAHDRHTRGHSERVRVYTDLIAAELRLPPAAVDRLRWAALLHDIGKLRIPKATLNKPAKLSTTEWDAVRQHPLAGADLAGALLPWLGEWGKAIAEHHERFDGKGYPLGLSGRDISLAGRIVAVADSFEVMTASRAYKKAMTRGTALAEVVKCSGTQFDPDVVRALLAVSAPRLRWAMGPTSWLVGTPLLGSAPSLTAAGVAAQAAVGVSAVAVAGVTGVAGPALAASTAPVPAPSAQPAVATHAAAPTHPPTSPQQPRDVTKHSPPRPARTTPSPTSTAVPTNPDATVSPTSTPRLTAPSGPEPKTAPGTPTPPQPAKATPASPTKATPTPPAKKAAPPPPTPPAKKAAPPPPAPPAKKAAPPPPTPPGALKGAARLLLTPRRRGRRRRHPATPSNPHSFTITVSSGTAAEPESPNKRFRWTSNWSGLVRSAASVVPRCHGRLRDGSRRIVAAERRIRGLLQTRPRRPYIRGRRLRRPERFFSRSGGSRMRQARGRDRIPSASRHQRTCHSYLRSTSRSVQPAANHLW